MKEYKEYLSKRLTWEEMVKLFPDKWVVVTENEYIHNKLKSGKLVAVCGDEELQEVLENIYDKDDNIKLYWKRTTEDFTYLGVF